jgi:hypothetical protein
MGRWISQVGVFLFLSGKLYSFAIGNPAQPALLTDGVIHGPTKTWAFRVAYFDDYVYAQHVKNEFNFGSVGDKPPVVTLSTDAAQITLNIRKWIDLYGIVGSAKLQLDQEIYTRRELAWGLGLKLMIYRVGNLRFGCDVKYFQTNQKPLYLVSSGLPLDVITNWYLRYKETQAALGLSYKAGFICPYINASYIVTKIEPQPFSFLVNVPGSPDPMDAFVHSLDGNRRWGMAVGATLLAGAKGTFAVESRFFNQNGLNASLEVRF